MSRFADRLTPLYATALRTGRLGAAAGLVVDRTVSIGPSRAWRLTKNEAGLLDRLRRELYRHLWTTAAVEIGATWHDLGGDVLEIRRDSNCVRLWRDLVPLDDPVTAHVSGDKPLCHRLLADAGLTVPAHRVFPTTHLSEAVAYAAEHGPSVVKPAAATGAGSGITGSVMAPSEAWRAVLGAVRFDDNRVLIERQSDGTEYRILVLRGQTIAAIERRRPEVVGDGMSSINMLIEAENARRRAGGWGEGYRRLTRDLDTELVLRRHGYILRSIPAAGERVTVATSASQGSARDASAVPLALLPDACRSAAERSASALGAQFVSVEIIVDESGELTVLEVNTSPGIAHHYLVDDPDAAPSVAELVLEHLLAGPPSTSSA